MDKVTVNTLKVMRQEGRKIVALTSYDLTTAKLLNEAGVDVVLVGDSVGMVKLGHASTLPVTVDDIAYYTKNVARGNSRALLIADMPFMSYQVSKEEAVRNCGRMLKAGAEGVKIEGGEEMVPVVRALKAASIPVMGHIGMTPQSVHMFGGYKVQGRDKARRKQILADAKALEKAGVFAIVLECVPADLGRQITKMLKIPTIGIGAGPDCSGQILVVDDMLGLTAPPLPRFVKRYADLRGIIRKAAEDYRRDVQAGRFPDSTHSYL